VPDLVDIEGRLRFLGPPPRTDSAPRFLKGGPGAPVDRQSIEVEALAGVRIH
jgi:hypothetical protein